MKKPLTKEERAWIVNPVADHCIGEPAVKRLLSAEAFWREAVQDSKSVNWCAFCGAHLSEGNPIFGPQPHKPECAWLLAQAVECAHEWHRRRDGRHCGKCGHVEFGA